MNEIMKILLSLSFSGSLIILVLLFCKPLFKNRICKRWQYYIWLVVVARLLLPFSPEASLVGVLFQKIDQVIVQTDNAPTADPIAAPLWQQPSDLVITDDTAPQDGGTSMDTALAPQRFFAVLMKSLWLIWLLAALALLIRKITIYQGFVHYMKAGRREVSDTALLDQLARIGEQLGVKKPVELYTNSLISSPLLIGFFRPCIVLPSANIAPADFKYTILHELIHYKRRDMFYKWLVQFSICMHWFNPLVYFMGREVRRACELSCDEAVIRTLDPQGRRAYGETLLNAIGARGSYKDSLASVTLNESKELLKERLDAIMNFKKHSKAMTGVTLLLTLIICCGAAYAGAYASPFSMPNQPSIADAVSQADEEKGQSASLQTPSVNSVRGEVQVNFTGVLVTGQGPVGVELVRSQDEHVTFELLNMDNGESCKAQAEIINGTMQITVSNDAPKGINVNFGPNYRNVVRVSIPNAVYTKFEIQSKEMVVQMQDFNGPVYVNANHAGFWLIDETISRGTYDIEATSGPVYIEADTILKDITVNARSGPITVHFRRTPKNLYLDSTGCGPVVARPDDWPAIYKAGNETPKIILRNIGKATITVKPTSNKVIREGGVYYIFCDGADERNKPVGGVTEGHISLVLVQKDRYTSIGPFDDRSRLYVEAQAQCESLLKAGRLTQEDVDSIMEVAANIQAGDEEGYEETPLLEDMYAKWKLVMEHDAYYYENARVRILMDLREDRSFANFHYDRLGTTDIRLIRGHDGNIEKMEYLLPAEAEEIQNQLDLARSNLSQEEGDISRLSKNMVSMEMLHTINSCDDGKWYVISEGGYQYLYYNGVPNNYAWQPAFYQDHATIQIFDIGKSTGTDVLLKVSEGLELDVYYQGEKIAYEKIRIT